MHQTCPPGRDLPGAGPGAPHARPCRIFLLPLHPRFAVLMFKRNAKTLSHRSGLFSSPRRRAGSSGPDDGSTQMRGSRQQQRRQHYSEFDYYWPRKTRTCRSKVRPSALEIPAKRPLARAWLRGCVARSKGRPTTRRARCPPRTNKDKFGRNMDAIGSASRLRLSRRKARRSRRSIVCALLTDTLPHRKRRGRFAFLFSALWREERRAAHTYSQLMGWRYDSPMARPCGHASGGSRRSRPFLLFFFSLLPLRI